MSLFKGPNVKTRLFFAGVFAAGALSGSVSARAAEINGAGSSSHPNKGCEAYGYSSVGEFIPGFYESDDCDQPRSCWVETPAVGTCGR